jgi:hypothetical protein
MEFLPEKGNPIIVRDSGLLLPGEDMPSCAGQLAEKTISRLIVALRFREEAPPDLETEAGLDSRSP